MHCADEQAKYEFHRELGLLQTYHEQGRQAKYDALFAEFEKKNDWDRLSIVYAWIGDADKASELLEAIELDISVPD